MSKKKLGIGAIKGEVHVPTVEDNMEWWKEFWGKEIQPFVKDSRPNMYGKAILEGSLTPLKYVGIGGVRETDIVSRVKELESDFEKTMRPIVEESIREETEARRKFLKFLIAGREVK